MRDSGQSEIYTLHGRCGVTGGCKRLSRPNNLSQAMADTKKSQHPDICSFRLLVSYAKLSSDPDIDTAQSVAALKVVRTTDMTCGQCASICSPLCVCVCLALFAFAPKQTVWNRSTEQMKCHEGHGALQVVGLSRRIEQLQKASVQRALLTLNQLCDNGCHLTEDIFG